MPCPPPLQINQIETKALVVIILVIVITHQMHRSNYMFIYIQHSKSSERVFSSCCRYWKLHNEYNQHVSEMYMHVPQPPTFVVKRPVGQFFHQHHHFIVRKQIRDFARVQQIVNVLHKQFIDQLGVHQHQRRRPVLQPTHFHDAFHVLPPFHHAVTFRQFNLAQLLRGHVTRQGRDTFSPTSLQTNQIETKRQ
jgi:hypothetical protein